jgi:hypothetical protein
MYYAHARKFTWVAVKLDYSNNERLRVYISTTPYAKQPREESYYGNSNLLSLK